MLIETPISTPGIFTLAGIAPGELAVIERTETDFRVRDGAHVAANHWEAAGWQGHARGIDSPGRARMMTRIAPAFEPTFPWLEPPILNASTRLAMVADAKAGRIIAQGFEAMKPATEPLDLTWDLRPLKSAVFSRFSDFSGRLSGSRATACASARKVTSRSRPRALLATERWQSGRSRRTRNAEYSQGYRGFESLPLRQFC